MPSVTPKDSALSFAKWADSGDTALGIPQFVRDGEAIPAAVQGLTIVLERGSEMRARELLEQGAAQVLLADAALLDSTVVTRLSQEYGTHRIGVSIPVEKRHISWALDTVSNADFRCLTPSIGKAGWEIVMSDGTATGTDAEWWLGEMLALGASMALIQADIEDNDLNLCAGLMENHGNKLWFSPWQYPDADLEPWVRYGQIRQLLLPTPNNRDEAEMSRLRAAAGLDQELLAAEAANVLV